MKAKSFYILNHDIMANAVDFIRQLPFKPLYEVRISKSKSLRSLKQNSKMWAMLTDISRQVCWHGLWLTPEDWKHMVSACIKQQQVVPGITGGFVALGKSTSRMSIKEMIDIIDFAYAFGNENKVKWTEPKEDIPPWA